MFFRSLYPPNVAKMEKVGNGWQYCGVMRMLWQCRNLLWKWTTSDPVFSIFPTFWTTFWNPFWDAFIPRQMTEIPSTSLSMIHGDWFAAMRRGHFCNTSSDELLARGFDMNSEPAANCATHQTATQWNEGNRHELTSWGTNSGILEDFEGFTVPVFPFVFLVHHVCGAWPPAFRGVLRRFTEKSCDVAANG